jgi:hypothetical protein
MGCKRKAAEALCEADEGAVVAPEAATTPRGADTPPRAAAAAKRRRAAAAARLVQTLLTRFFGRVPRAVAMACDADGEAEEA